MQWYSTIFQFRLPSSQFKKSKPNDFDSNQKSKVFWSTAAPKIDLSKEFSKENKLDDVIREKHSTNVPTNFTIIIESTNNLENIVLDGKTQSEYAVSTNSPQKQRDDER